MVADDCEGNSEKPRPRKGRQRLEMSCCVPNARSSAGNWPLQILWDPLTFSQSESGSIGFRAAGCCGYFPILEEAGFVEPQNISLATSQNMSGMEVAGVILGVLPLAIKAVKQYMDILSSVKDATRTLKYLLQDLETEQVRLETTCEVLLDSIVPHDVIDRLIRTPLGSEWKQYNEKLRLRLWSTAQRFEEQIAELQVAVEELRTKLCIEPDGTVCHIPKFKPPLYANPVTY